MIEDMIKVRLGDPTFIIAPRTYDINTLPFGSIDVVDYSIDVSDKLLEYNILEADDYIVLHGIICKAETLPDKIDKGISCYILVIDEGQAIGGILDLGSKITMQTAANSIQELAAGDDANFSIPIEQIYVIYGYDINMRITIDEDDIDEDLLREAKKASKKAKALLEMENKE